MKILIVEDDPIARLVLESALKSLGHEVIAANEGESAWTLLRDRSIRLVVSDWQMPGVDGLELCRRIRSRDGEYVSFVLLTQSSASDDNIQQAMEAGVDDFLAKPFNLQELKLRLYAASRISGLALKVRELESFLPICGYCKSIRDDQNYWQQIESYINARTGTRFSHGVCPACYDRVVLPQLKELGLDARSDADRDRTSHA